MPYPFDPTGTALQNTVIGEELVLPIKTSTNFLFALPAQGPFFYDSLIVKFTPLTGESVILNPGVDYLPGFQYFEATSKCNRYICGAIQLTDITKTGKLTLKYNCVGTPFVPTTAQLNLIGSTEVRDPQFTTWEMVCFAANLTLAEFPTTAEVWNGIDSPNIQKAIDDLSKLGLVVQLRPEILTEPTDVKYIPTPTEVGLGDVKNYPIATKPHAEEGLVNDEYMTPLRTSQAIEAQLADKLALIGYKIPVDYQPNITFTTTNQTVTYGDNVYTIRPECLPLTTTGDFYVDKEKLILLNTTSRDHWQTLTYTVTGQEAIDPITKAILIPTGLSFDSDIDCKLIIHPFAELTRQLDFHLHNGLIKLMYRCASGDEISFQWKRKLSLMSSDRPYHHAVKVTDGARTFTLPDFSLNNADDVRVCLNEFVILVKTRDYTITGDQFTTLFPLKIGDTIEITNQEAVPHFGVMQTRSMLFHIG